MLTWFRICRNVWAEACFRIPFAAVAFDSFPYTKHAPDCHWAGVMQQLQLASSKEIIAQSSVVKSNCLSCKVLF
jgi:hypothetical protein